MNNDVMTRKPVWCIAKELSIPEIFHQMRYEGHFCIVVSAADHVIFKVARKND